MPDAALIPIELVPPGVADRRNRDFVAALSVLLSGFSTKALIIQDPMTVDAAFLPAMTIERGMLDFISPGMREPLLRQLLAAAPEIHAFTGTIRGVRMALAAIGVETRWKQ